MPASDRVAPRARKARMAKWGFAGHALRIWLKISRGNAWLIPYHRIILPNNRGGAADATDQPMAVACSFQTDLTVVQILTILLVIQIQIQ